MLKLIKFLRAPSAKKAKQIANAAVKHDADSQIWQTCSLADILLAKATSYSSFRDALLSSENNILVEATQDLFWRVGLSPVQIQHTKPNFFNPLAPAPSIAAI